MYELPLGALDKARRNATLTLIPLVVSALLVGAIFVASAPDGFAKLGVNYLLAGLPFPILAALGYLVIQPILSHDALRITRDGIVPLKKPVRAPRGVELLANEIREIRFDGWPGLEEEMYRFLIITHDGRRFAVPSSVLARYDSRPGTLKRVKGELDALASVVDQARSHPSRQ